MNLIISSIIMLIESVIADIAIKIWKDTIAMICL